MATSQIFINVFIGLASGYLLGRIGHFYINVWLKNPGWTPHHWIYGAILIPAGSFINSSFWGLVIIFFGIGHLISDLKDFIELKFFGPDEEGPKRFFHID